MCYLLDAGQRSDAWITPCLAEGSEAGQKLFRLAPTPSSPTTADVTVLEPGPLVASTMYAMFRREAALAREEGYRGLRLIAEMDWLLAQPPTPKELFDFELMLDEVVAELNATFVCAYRVSQYAPENIAELVAVHPLSTGDAPADLNFRMWNVDRGTWELSGEIDILNSAQFHRALATASAHGPLRRLSLARLTFISVDGIAALAEAAAAQATHPLIIHRATSVFHDCWTFLGLADRLPHVTFEQVLG